MRSVWRSGATTITWKASAPDILTTMIMGTITAMITGIIPIPMPTIRSGRAAWVVRQRPERHDGLRLPARSRHDPPPELRADPARGRPVASAAGHRRDGAAPHPCLRYARHPAGPGLDAGSPARGPGRAAGGQAD